MDKREFDAVVDTAKQSMLKFGIYAFGIGLILGLLLGWALI